MHVVNQLRHKNTICALVYHSNLKKVILIGGHLASLRAPFFNGKKKKNLTCSVGR